MKIIKSKNYYGEYDIVPVSDEFYEYYHELEKEKQRLYREDSRHLVYVSLHDIDSYVQYPSSSKIEDDLIVDEETQELYRAIAKLPPVQKRRLRKMIEEDMDSWDLHKNEDVDYKSVKECVNRALKKLKTLLPDHFNQ